MLNIREHLHWNALQLWPTFETFTLHLMYVAWHSICTVKFFQFSSVCSKATTAQKLRTVAHHGWHEKKCISPLRYILNYYIPRNWVSHNGTDRKSLKLHPKINAKLRPRPKQQLMTHFQKISRLLPFIGLLELLGSQITWVWSFFDTVSWRISPRVFTTKSLSSQFQCTLISCKD